MNGDCGCSRVDWSSCQSVEGIVRARLRGLGTIGFGRGSGTALHLLHLCPGMNIIAQQIQGEQAVHRIHLHVCQAALRRHFPVCRPAFLSLSRKSWFDMVGGEQGVGERKDEGLRGKGVVRRSRCGAVPRLPHHHVDSPVLSAVFVNSRSCCCKRGSGCQLLPPSVSPRYQTSLDRKRDS
ncbi:hypothetical protein BDW02DRAFT_282556 [Decorospora gaudefroyi]|uniref:Uncharacterized protein n=1 Tax=Decorospora gaudefroyi TaxID=184978 RepID=A0A6A5KIZ5_9PLEO|nr:hypothetical protein BDW02DRAFT_282556 [Decorospora gaudefroyi]